MFVLDDTLEKLDIDASKLLKLCRSMRDVQMALPGFPSQEASAYLCQYQTGKSVATYAAFHLQRSCCLAFYRSEPPEVSKAKADGLFDQGLNFVESMGFLMSDMDIDLKDAADRKMLWESLPLFLGCEEKETVTEAKPQDVPAPKESPSPEETVTEPVSEPQKISAPADLQPPDAADEETEGVDELLAAVENLRARRPELTNRKKTPTRAEMKKRCLEFKENLGRILSSL